MKKNILIIILLVFVAVSYIKSADAVLPQRVDDYINDFAGVLTATDKASISTILSDLSEKYGAVFSVVTVNSVEEFAPGYDSEAFALAAYNGWKLDEKTGKAMLILISIKDRSVAMEFGNAKDDFYESIMKKVVVARMLPNFKEGDYGRGIYEGVRTLSKVIQNKSDITEIFNKYLPQLLGLIIIMFIVTIVMVVLKKSVKNKPLKSNEEKVNAEKLVAQKKEINEVFGGGAAGNW